MPDNLAIESNVMCRYVRHFAMLHTQFLIVCLCVLQMCLAAAATLACMHLSAGIFKQFVPRKLARWLSRAATAVVVSTIVVLSLSRSAALVINYGAPMRLYRHLPQVNMAPCAACSYQYRYHCNAYDCISAEHCRQDQSEHLSCRPASHFLTKVCGPRELYDRYRDAVRALHALLAEKQTALHTWIPAVSPTFDWNVQELQVNLFDTHHCFTLFC